MQQVRAVVISSNIEIHTYMLTEVISKGYSE
jgi:hypothetical protein